MVSLVGLSDVQLQDSTLLRSLIITHPLLYIKISVPVFVLHHSRTLSTLFRALLQVYQLMAQGQTNRAVGSHDMNEHSSRSHSILTIAVK